jgi:hypothetical protein
MSRTRIGAACLAAVLVSAANPIFGADPQFGGHCAMSVAQGTPVPTDCSIYWISPEDKLYCFVSEQARERFIADSKRNATLAEAFWRDPAFWERLKEQQ